MTSQGRRELSGLRRHWSDVWDLLEADKDVRVILLRRRDLLKQLLSQNIARRSHGNGVNAYTCATSRSDKGLDPEPVRIEIQELLSFIDESERDWAQIKRRFASHQTTGLQYEDLAADPQRSVDRIFAFLDLPTVGLRRSKMKIQEDRSLHEAIANFDEIQETFGNTEIAGDEWRVHPGSAPARGRTPSQARRDACETGIVTTGPKSVHLDLINACQLDCVTCWNYSPYLEAPKPVSWKRGRMSRTMAVSLLEDLSSLGVRRVILSGGGEIFLHADLMDIIRTAKARGLKLTLITNLLATTLSQANELVELGVETILANVSAADEASYAAFHPNERPGAFARLCERLEILRHVKGLKLVQVVCSTNWNLLGSMIEVAHRYRPAKLQLKLANLSAAGTEQFAITDDQRRTIQRDLPRLREDSERHGVEVNWDAFARQLDGKSTRQFPIEEIGCYSGYYYARVTCEGDVRFCCAPLKVGNVGERPFSEIWFDYARQGAYRNLMRRERYLPVCSSCGKWTLNWKVYKDLKARRGAVTADGLVTASREGTLSGVRAPTTSG